MRQIVGYTLITAAFAGFIVWLVAALCDLANTAVYISGALGMLAAGCALCADELFGDLIPKRKSRK